MPERATGLKRRHWAIALSATYAFSLASAFMSTYLPRWLVSVGWTSAAVGTLLGIATLLRSAVMPGWARIAEMLGRVGPVVRWLSLIGTAALWFLPFVTTTAPVYTVLIVSNITWSAYLPLVDALTIRELGNDAFGRVRAWGSAAFGVAALTVAWFGMDASHQTVAGWAPWAIASLATLATACVWSYPRSEVEIASPSLAEAIRLLKRPALYLLLPLWGLHWAAQAPFNLFLVFLCEDRGMGGWVPGAAVALGVTAEVFVLAFGAPLLKRIGPERFFAVCAVATCIRWFASAAVTSPWALIALQAVHGLSFGGFLLAAMATLDREIPPEVRSSGQALLYVVVFGAGGALGNASAGWVEEVFGAIRAFEVAGVVELVVVVGVLAMVSRRRQ